MIARADFSRVLMGLEPVIQGPPDRERVRCLGFDFAQIPSMGIASRFFLPTAEAIEWPDMHAPSLRNPLLPVWDPWPGEIHAVPYPAEDRTMLLTLDWSGVVEATWETIPSFRDPRDVAMERNFLASVGTWPASLASVAARYTHQYFDALRHVVEVESPSRYPAHPWLAPRVDARTPVAGDDGPNTTTWARIQELFNAREYVEMGTALRTYYAARGIPFENAPPILELDVEPVRALSPDPPLLSIMVSGDEDSRVPSDAIATLVELARQDRYQDFVDLAGAVGVGKAEWNALWKGTRARVGAPIEEEDPPV